MPVVVVDTLPQVRWLADHILNAARTEPVVCVSTRQNSSSPLLNAEALAEAAGALPIYVLPTGELSWELNAALPEHFEVYGGASRIWWPGLLPADNPRQHPLIFCWFDYEAPAAATRILRELAHRGWDVEYDDAPHNSGTSKASVPVRASVPRTVPAEDAFTHFAVGDVVDARVVAVHLGGIEVEMPDGRRTLIINRRGRTAPPRVAGDAVSVEVTSVNSTTHGIGLRWLPESEPAPVPRAVPSPTEVARRHQPASVPEDTTRVETATPPASIDRLRDEAREISAALVTDLAETRARIQEFAAEQLDDVLSALEDELEAARAEARQFRLQLAAAEYDKRNAIAEMRKHRDRANDAEKQSRRERGRRVHAEDLAHGRGAYEDPETQFRHEISVACQHLKSNLGPDAGQPRDFVLGPDFLDTLFEIEGQGIKRSQIVAKVAAVLLDAPIEGHGLRASEGGGVSQVVRSSDGAKGHRFFLQQRTSSARRLHCWYLTDGRIELANVGVHDDIVIR